MRIKNFKDWVNEDFAAVGIAPEGNVIGMGNVAPPTANSTGSGDMWPSLGAPATQSGSPKKKRRKKKKKKLNEGSSDLHQDSDIPHSKDAILSGAAMDSSVSTRNWINFFSDIYQVDAAEFHLDQEKLREIFTKQLMSVWVTFDWEEPGETENETAYKNDGWEIIATEVDDRGRSGGVTRILVKPYTEKEIEENYQEVLDEIKTNHKLSKKEFDWMFSTLKPEDKEKLTGTAIGKQYGI